MNDTKVFILITKTLLLVMSLLSAPTNAKALVYLYTYHNKPPFVINQAKEEGLYFDLAASLSEHSPLYDFKTVYMPRKRLDHIISRQQLHGIVLGAAPRWFNDPDETVFRWSVGFYQDRDEFVSLKSAPFNYKKPSSFENKSLATVAGYYYFGINEAVLENKLSRVDTVGELQVLELIAKQRVDFGIVSYSVFKYLIKNGDVIDIYHTSPIPHDEFQRRAFSPKALTPALEEFNRLIQRFKKQGHLASLIGQYQ